jgi:hypothetical protein
MAFQDLMLTLDSWGVTDILLPFILIFTIVFAVLQKSKVLGEDSKKFNVIIALVMGLSVVIPHALGAYPYNLDPVIILNSILPQVSVVIVAIMLMLVLIGVFGAKIKVGGTSLAGIVSIFAFIVILIIFANQLGWFTLPQIFDTIFMNEDILAIVVMILVFALIIGFVTGSDKDKQDKDKSKKFFDFIVDGKPKE